jgi:hypothetical protein
MLDNVLDAIEPFTAAVLIPVFFLVLRKTFSDEVTYWMTFIYCYFYRPFDLDGNPETHDWAMIYNNGNGTWECCSLTFRFTLFKGESGVFVHHYDSNQNVKFIERVRFQSWKDVRKARLVIPYSVMLNV